MINYQADAVEFAREYQKRAISLHVNRMNWFQRLFVASYFFGDSKAILAHQLSERLAGNQHAVNNFLRRFPMTRKTLLEISRAMIHETMEPTKYPRHK